MLKPSLWLSILTTLVAANFADSTSHASKTTQKPSNQLSLLLDEELTETQKINEEARRSLGRELL